MIRILLCFIASVLGLLVVERQEELVHVVEHLLGRYNHQRDGGQDRIADIGSPLKPPAVHAIREELVLMTDAAVRIPYRETLRLVGG